MSNDKQQSTAPRSTELTRIPAKNFRFRDLITFPETSSGYSALSTLSCVKGTSSRYVLCHWIPAWQMFEFTFYEPGKEPMIRMLPAAGVAQWEVA